MYPWKSLIGIESARVKKQVELYERTSVSETNTFYGIKNSFSLSTYFILKFREYKCLTIWISTLNPLCTKSIQIVYPPSQLM